MATIGFGKFSTESQLKCGDVGIKNTQKIRDVDPMTVYRWTNVCNAGSTLNQHWLNVSCLLGRPTTTVV